MQNTQTQSANSLRERISLNPSRGDFVFLFVVLVVAASLVPVLGDSLRNLFPHSYSARHPQYVSLGIFAAAIPCAAVWLCCFSRPSLWFRATASFVFAVFNIAMYWMVCSNQSAIDPGEQLLLGLVIVIACTINMVVVAGYLGLEVVSSTDEVGAHLKRRRKIAKYAAVAILVLSIIVIKVAEVTGQLVTIAPTISLFIAMFYVFAAFIVPLLVLASPINRRRSTMIVAVYLVIVACAICAYPILRATMLVNRPLPDIDSFWGTELYYDTELWLVAAISWLVTMLTVLGYLRQKSLSVVRFKIDEQAGTANAVAGDTASQKVAPFRISVWGPIALIALFVVINLSLYRYDFQLSNNSKMISLADSRILKSLERSAGGYSVRDIYTINNWSELVRLRIEVNQPDLRGKLALASELTCLESVTLMNEVGPQTEKAPIDVSELTALDLPIPGVYFDGLKFMPSEGKPTVPIQWQTVGIHDCENVHVLLDMLAKNSNITALSLNLCELEDPIACVDAINRMKNLSRLEMTLDEWNGEALHLSDISGGITSLVVWGDDFTEEFLDELKNCRALPVRFISTAIPPEAIDEFAASNPFFNIAIKKHDWTIAERRRVVSPNIFTEIDQSDWLMIALKETDGDLRAALKLAGFETEYDESGNIIGLKGERWLSTDGLHKLNELGSISFLKHFEIAEDGSCFW